MTVRLRDGRFTSLGRSVSLAQASTEPDELRAAALTALAAAVDARGLEANEESGAGARLLGVSFGALSPSTQLSLIPAGNSAPRSVPTGGAIVGSEAAEIAAAARWVPGQDVMHSELGRGWIVQVVDTGTSMSGVAEVAARFEVTGSRSGRQRRFAAADAHLIAAAPVAVQPLST